MQKLPKLYAILLHDGSVASTSADGRLLVYTSRGMAKRVINDQKKQSKLNLTIAEVTVNKAEKAK